MLTVFPFNICFIFDLGIQLKMLAQVKHNFELF